MRSGSEFPFSFAITGTVATPPEITVLGSGLAITNGSATPSAANGTDFGGVMQGSTPVIRTFMVRNDGGAALTLGTVSVPAGYTLTKVPASSLAPGASDTFTVQLETATAGTKTGEISFANNDGDGGDGVENPFHFRITGLVTPTRKAGHPNPADGAVGVTSPLLMWTAGAGAVSHDVYLGTTSSLTASNLVASHQTMTMYFHVPGLTPGTTYYWRIDEIAADATVVQGDVWSFTTAGAEITVLGNGISIADGDTTPSSTDGTDFGRAFQGGTPVSRTFTVRNDGNATLTLAAVMVPTGFTLMEGLSSSLLAGASDTFTVRLDTAVGGAKAGDISFANNDADENPFNFRVTGVVYAPGDLDPTFGDPGRVTTPIGTSDDEGYGVALQSDGRIVVAGYSSNGSDCDFAVLRYNSNGSLDVSFGGAGKVTTPIGSSDDEGCAVALQSDGKIVVAGDSSNGSDLDFAVVRYNTNGSLDTSFGGTGKVTTSVGFSDDYGLSVAIQTDGKIVVAGSSDNGSNYDFAVVRYNTNGSLDTTFGATGKVTTPVGSSDDYGMSIAIQSDGKIVVAGSSYNGSSYDFAVVRYNTNGSLDTSFGGTGKLTTSVGSFDDEGYGVAIQSNGKIVVVGASSPHGSDADFAVVRYNTNGSLDTSFGGTGKVTTPIGPANAYGECIAIQSDGRILAVGETDYDFALVRYNDDGSLDTSFGGTGKVTTSIGSFDSEGYGVAIESDGKIVAAGSSYNGSDYDVAVVRYNASGSLDILFGGTGKLTTPIGTSDDRGYSVAIQPDGKIVVAGTAYNGSDYDFAVARYNSDGSPDTSFAGTGTTTTSFDSWDDNGESVALQADGKIVVAGASYIDGDYDFAVVRYNSDGSLDTSFAGAGGVTTPIGLCDDVGFSVAIQPDGKTVVAGYSDNGSNDDFALVRYNADGSLDTSFGGTGKVTTPIGAFDDRGCGVASSLTAGSWWRARALMAAIMTLPWYGTTPMVLWTPPSAAPAR